MNDVNHQNKIVQHFVLSFNIDHQAVHHRPPQRKLIPCKMTAHHLNPGKLISVSLAIPLWGANNFQCLHTISIRKCFVKLTETKRNYQIYNRYDNHSPQSTTARNGGASDNLEGERNGSSKHDPDDDIKTENDNDVSQTQN